VLDSIDEVEAVDWGNFGTAGTLDDTPFAAAITNFYMTDPISRASETMAACTETFVNAGTEKTGTDG